MTSYISIARFTQIYYTIGDSMIYFSTINLFCSIAAIRANKTRINKTTFVVAKLGRICNVFIYVWYRITFVFECSKASFSISKSKRDILVISILESPICI